MKIIGFDSAVQEANIGLVLCDYTNDVLTIEDIKEAKKTAEDQIIKWSDTDEKIVIGIDSPLGWPSSFGSSLSTHLAGNCINTDADSFFVRKTDKFIYETFKKKPLEISADRIARTAYFTLNRICSINSQIVNTYELLWDYNAQNNGFIEVYPAATLLANDIDIKGYKDNKDCRKRILKELEIKYPIKIPADIDIINIDHYFDAFVCCLSVYDFIQGTVYFPNCQIEHAQTEGWIWTKKKIT